MPSSSSSSTHTMSSASTSSGSSMRSVFSRRGGGGSSRRPPPAPPIPSQRICADYANKVKVKNMLNLILGEDNFKLQITLGYYEIKERSRDLTAAEIQNIQMACQTHYREMYE